MTLLEAIALCVGVMHLSVLTGAADYDHKLEDSVGDLDSDLLYNTTIDLLGLKPGHSKFACMR